MRKRNNKIPWKERDELEQVFKNTLGKDSGLVYMT